MKKILFLTLVLIFTTMIFADERDIYGYSVLSSNQTGGPTYEWLDYSTDNEVTGLTDDSCSGAVDIGFQFPFYANNYEQLFINSNGLILFGEGSNDYYNVNIPNLNDPNNFIAWFWDDLRMNYDWANSHIYYENQTINDMQAFVISCISVSEYGGTSAPEDCIQAQVILYENGNIKINYDYFGSSLDIQSATIGIENSDGVDGELFDYNNGEVLEDDMAVEFYYPIPQTHDMQAVSLIGPTFAMLGEELTYNLTVRNRGENPESNFVINLKLDDSETILATKTINTSVDPSTNFTDSLSFVVLEEYSGPHSVYGEVVLDTDLNSLNNITSPFSVRFQHPLDLQAVSISNYNAIIANIPSTFNINVRNHGESQDNFEVQVIDAEDNVLGTTTVNETIGSNSNMNVPVEVIFPIGGEYNLRGKVILEGEIGIQDNITISSVFNVNFENDLEALSVSVPGMLQANVPVQVAVSVFNKGADNDNFEVQVMDAEDNILGTTAVNETIESLSTTIINLSVIFPNEGIYNIKGKVINEEDEDITNNITDLIAIEVISSDIASTQIGNGESLKYLPWNAWYKNSLSQVIYFQDEFNGFSGEINGISYEYVFADTMTNRSFEMWLAEVEDETINGAWLPTEQFTQVYDGLVSFNQGEGTLNIIFDQPFNYSGNNNLCVMVRRGDRSYLSDRKFKCEETLNHQNRSAMYFDDILFPDLENLPVIQGYHINSYVPNTIFMFGEGMAATSQIAGNIYDTENEIIPNARITLENGRYTTADNNGYYHFNNVFLGAHSLTASKFGYYDATIDGVNVEEGVLSEQDITMTILPRITVSGRIVASDALDVGVEGVDVSLSGFASYSTITDDSGLFTIENVYADRSYYVEVIKQGYTTINDSIVVGTENYDLGDFVINEIAYSANNVVVTQNDEDTSVLISWNPPSIRSLFTTDFEGKRSYPSTRIYNNNRGLQHFSPITMNARSLQGYRIYRLNMGDEEVEMNWTEITTGIITENSFNYDGWNDLEEGYYYFAVKAVYSNDVLSAPMISNWVGKDKFTDATVNITMVDGSSPVGANIILIGLTVDPDGARYTYTDTVDTSGTKLFPQVFKGTYNVVVSKEGYATYIQEGTIITESTTINVNVTENMIPPGNLQASVSNDDVTLIWNEPDNLISCDFENTNGGFVSNDVNGWQWGVPNSSYNDVDINEAHSGSNVWGTVLTDHYQNNANWTLDTPIFNIPDNSVLSFYHNYYSEGFWDGGNVKISNDGGSTWTLVIPEGGYSGTTAGLGDEMGYHGASYGWVEAVFPLTEYYGQNVMFRFTFGSDSSADYYLGWYIDDFSIRPVRRERAGEISIEHIVDHKVINSNIRALESYKVMRGTVVLAETLNDTTYVDSDLENGDYEYSVYAVYTDGLSDPVTVSVAVYPVSISGVISGNDTNGEGLENCTVHIYNEQFDFTSVTAANGEFSYTAQGNQIYNVQITHPMYNGYTGTIEVAGTDFVFNVTLNENTYSPGSVSVTKDDLCSETTITWTAPRRNGEFKLSSNLKKSKVNDLRTLVGYNVYRLSEGEENNENNWVQVGENISELTTTEMLPMDLVPGLYKYAVKTLYTGDLISEAIISEAIMLTEPLLPVSNLDFTIDGLSVTVTWEVPSRALSGYKIYLNGNYMTTIALDSYTFNDLVEDVNYTVGVSALYSNIYESPIETIEFTGQVNIPNVNAFLGNHPNPFNPRTTIKWQQKDSGRVIIDIYDITGKKVITLVDKEYKAGENNFEWQGKDSNNRNVSSGMYFVRVKILKDIYIRKILLMK